MTQVNGAGASVADDEVTALLAASIERILADNCTPAALRACEGEGAAGTGACALWAALEAAGLASALSADGEDGALGWPEVRPMLEACGRYGLPVPLAESLAAQALARLAGASLPDGATTVAAARAEDASVIAESVAHARLATRALVSLPEGDGTHALWMFDLARARLEPSVGIAEERARLVWSRADGRALGRLPAGVSALAAGAAVRCAQIAGACARAVEMTCGYANDRVQFGRPIAKFQAIQHMLAIAAGQLAAATAAADALSSLPTPNDDLFVVAAAKARCSEAVGPVAAITHQLHGAMGFTHEHPLHFSTRRLWSWRDEGGSETYWQEWIGRLICTRGSETFWPLIVNPHMHAADTPPDRAVV